MSNRLYNLQQLNRAITQVLGVSASAYNDYGSIISRAMNWVTNQFQWRWRERPISINIASINLPATATTSNWAYNPYTNSNVTTPAAWDNSTGTGAPIYRDTTGLTWVYSPSHGLQSGLYVNVQSVTQAVSDNVPFNGSFTVVSTPDANTYTYANPGTGATQDLNPVNASGSGNGYGFWIGGQYTLPTDFMSMKTLRCPSLSLKEVISASLDQIMIMRQYQLGTTLEIYYCVTSVPQATPGLEPAKMLYIFPTPQAAQANFLQGVYIRKLPQLVNLTDVPDVPSEYQDLILHACRAFAISTEEDRSGEDWRIVQDMLVQFKQEDGIAQDPAGQMKRTVYNDRMPGGNWFGYRTIGTN